MPRPSLEERLADPGFTPGKRDFADLYGAIVGADEALAESAERAITKAGLGGAAALLREATKAPPPDTTAFRIARVLGAIGGDEATAYLRARLANGTGKERRWAGTSLAKVAPQEAEEALLEALSASTRGEDVRAFVQALGKLGGERTTAALDTIVTDDPETARVVEKAKLLLSRTAERSDAGALPSLSASLPRVTVRVSCRDGLESVLAEELAALGASVSATGKGRVTVMHEGPLTTLADARTALSLAIEFDVPRRARTDLATRVAEVLASDDVAEIVKAAGPGPIATFRLVLPEGEGRAAIFAIAGKIAKTRSLLRNDPTSSAWTIVVEPRDSRLSVLLEPRQGLRVRRGGRVRDVPAASHPTIAAALVRLTGPRPSDVVWDPFCGAGTELLERAAFGPFRGLVGSDIDDDALAAADQNLQHARVSATLVAGSALDCPLPRGIDVVVTNPPLGRRIRGEHGTLLDALLRRIGKILPLGGRFVWVSRGRRFDPLAEAAGLRLVRAHDVDLGGFSGRIEVRIKSDAD